MKLLRGTYGEDAVIRTTKGDQISVKLDGQTAVVNLETLVRCYLLLCRCGINYNTMFGAVIILKQLINILIILDSVLFVMY